MPLLAEHRAVVKARLWDFDPFVHDSGSALRNPRSESLKTVLKNMIIQETNEDEDDDGDTTVNLSTKTILRHYSKLVRDLQR